MLYLHLITTHHLKIHPTLNATTTEKLCSEHYLHHQTTLDDKGEFLCHFKLLSILLSALLTLSDLIFKRFTFL